MYRWERWCWCCGDDISCLFGGGFFALFLSQMGCVYWFGFSVVHKTCIFISTFFELCSSAINMMALNHRFSYVDNRMQPIHPFM
ncbi:hypothetical protein ASPWEDRAFT_463030 [Aspergillus wentii DTO 134E9]|uniref:Uncharacterized protein n=1 Tax=Aspergillus wentii DTO 134E9 TaxID=1073089 RepID=A0A1L9RRR5_ASPWE|nr:uncharacterized protein ASPWEDRAFT_463030 [Aspergillus wentii DTO 134E9]OJJ37631.1 hypothetical protein ASPWEDRAFT_463030 [Aspergillus wentii DTO 134E9]